MSAVATSARRVSLIDVEASVEIEAAEDGSVYLAGSEGVVHIPARLIPDLIDVLGGGRAS